MRDQKYWRKYRWRQPGDDDDAPEEEEEEEAAAAAADTKDAKPGGEAAPVAAAAEVGAGAHKSATRPGAWAWGLEWVGLGLEP